MDVDHELLSEFLTESLQGLQSIEQDLLLLEEQSSTDKEIVNRVFRVVHTMKGTGGYMGLNSLVRLSHLAETILDEVRSGQREADPPVVDAILAAFDELTKMLHQPEVEVDLTQSEATLLLTNLLEKGKQSAQPKQSKTAGETHDATSDTDTLSDSAIAKLWDGRSFVYRLEVDLAKLHEAIDIKEGVVAGLTSVGKILHSSMPLDAIDKTNSGTCALVYETVLDRALMSSYLAVPADKILKVELKAPARAVKPVLSSTTNPANQPSQAETQAASAPEKATPAQQEKEATPKGSVGQAVSGATKEKSSSGTVEMYAKGAAAGKVPSDQTMRVPVSILNELLEWTGTMVMARNQLLNEFDFLGNLAFRTLSQSISGVHETIIATRMQTTGNLFERYKRVVRDLGRQLEKEVALHIEGGELELDRSILESFADPLTHLIRNCMDHALETPAEREIAGKNRQGNIYLRSYIQSGEIIIEVEDDGRGISTEMVCRKAVAKNVITEAEAARLTDHEKLFLIFRPGFSTKDTATDVSGRGVGMDVVKNNIEAVGGSVDVQTHLGQGTRFSAMLPLAKALVSSSLTKALIVEIQGEQFAIPETAVSEIIRLNERTLASTTQVDGQLVFQLRDKLVAIVDLPATIQLKSPNVPNDAVLADPSNPSRCLVVFQYRKHLFSAVVDNVLGIQEIIVRSTPKLLQSCPVYSGHTVLGNGRVSLILDINGIVQKLNLKFSTNTKKQGESPDVQLATAIPSKCTSQKMLLFSYAKGEYFAIPLELTAIIERIERKDLRMVGEKEFCQIKNETLSVMRLDSFLPIGRLDESRNDLCLVRAASIAFPIGLLVGSDISVIDVDESFETRVNDSKGVLGTFLHKEKLVMLLDLYSLFEKHAPDKVMTKTFEPTKARILVAEDSLFFRKLIEQYMSCEHWELEVVNDGLEAWDKLNNNPQRYQMLISDINMPRMDGFELAGHVRNDRRFDSMPMVALTTMSEDHFREKGLSLGFDRYVIKIDKGQVRNTVAECLTIQRGKPR